MAVVQDVWCLKTRNINSKQEDGTPVYLYLGLLPDQTDFHMCFNPKDSIQFASKQSAEDFINYVVYNELTSFTLTATIESVPVTMLRG